MPAPYDPTRKSLYSPEWQPTVFERDKPYTDPQICAEASRLAYIKDETSAIEKDKLSTALSLLGYHQLAQWIATAKSSPPLAIAKKAETPAPPATTKSPPKPGDPARSRYATWWITSRLIAYFRPS
jgi:hypothetical protein